TSWKANSGRHSAFLYHKLGTRLSFPQTQVANATWGRHSAFLYHKFETRVGDATQPFSITSWKCEFGTQVSFSLSRVWNATRLLSFSITSWKVNSGRHSAFLYHKLETRVGNATRLLS